MPKKTSPVVFAEKLMEGASERQNKRVDVNTRIRGLFTITMLVGGADRLLTAQPEKHCRGVNAGNVIDEPIYTRTLLQLSSPPDVRRPKRWI